MNEYISREAVKQVFCGIANGLSVGETEAFKTKDVKALYKIKGAKEILNAVDNDLSFIPVADVQPVNQWISVDDKLPDDCVEVLVYDTDCGIVIGWYDKETGDFAADFISPLDAVTHWQPLPEPPKED